MMLICHPLAPNCISNSDAIILHPHTSLTFYVSLVLSQTCIHKIAVCHKYDDHRKTHTVSPQHFLINKMVCSLPQGWANQAQGHKSLPTGDAVEGHRPLFIGNLSPNYLDRESDTLATGRHQHHVCS